MACTYMHICAFLPAVQIFVKVYDTIRIGIIYRRLEEVVTVKEVIWLKEYQKGYKKEED